MDTRIQESLRDRLFHPDRQFESADGSIGRSVAEAVSVWLRRRILDGTLVVGERLLQEELAEVLGISRQPVREALQQLIAEGLLVRLPDRGVAVRQFSPEAIRENYILRAALESTAARYAAANATQRQLIATGTAQASMSRAVGAGDSASAIEFNAQVHRLIHESSHMPTLIALINQLWIGLTVFTPLFVPGRAERSIHEHDAVIAAIGGRDGDSAEVQMRQHIEAAATDYFTYQEVLSSRKASDGT